MLYISLFKGPSHKLANEEHWPPERILFFQPFQTPYKNFSKSGRTMIQKDKSFEGWKSFTYLSPSSSKYSESTSGQDASVNSDCRSGDLSWEVRLQDMRYMLPGVVKTHEGSWEIGDGNRRYKLNSCTIRVHATLPAIGHTSGTWSIIPVSYMYIWTPPCTGVHAVVL